MSGAEGFAYLARCSDNTLYCGWTNDLAARIAAHNDGKGAKYTKSRRPVTLVYFERLASKSEAMKREAAIKKLSRAEKERLVAEFAQPVEIPQPNTTGGDLL